MRVPLSVKGKKFNGRVYKYVENVSRKSAALEEAKTFRRGGHLARVVPLVQHGRAVSYDIYVRWMKPK